MQILITGGAGFIGGHLAEQFTLESHDVVAFDNFQPFYDLGIKEHNVEQARYAATEADRSYPIIHHPVRNGWRSGSVLVAER